MTLVWTLGGKISNYPDTIKRRHHTSSMHDVWPVVSVTCLDAVEMGEALKKVYGVSVSHDVKKFRSRIGSFGQQFGFSS